MQTLRQRQAIARLDRRIRIKRDAAMWNFFVKKIILNFIIKNIDAMLAKLPGNEQKTVTGYFVSILGIVVAELPTSADYVGPVLEHLQQLPLDQIVAGGLLWGSIGAFHKVIKWLKGVLEKKTAVETYSTRLK